MNLNLANQVAFVAGSSRGIGRAIAAALLREGAKVVITGRDEEILQKTVNSLATAENQARILPIAGDFTDHTAIRSAFAGTIGHFGKLDHLIVSIGSGTGTPGPTPPADDWTRLFDQNFFAAVRLTEAGIPHLRTYGGSILYLSSIAALEATPSPLPFCAAKAALTNYAKNLSRHLAPDNIRVNTICPGNIFFPGGNWDRHFRKNRQAVEAMLLAEVPQNRFGNTDEIASLATYLCSTLAAFSTGGTYVMDGGQTRSI